MATLKAIERETRAEREWRGRVDASLALDFRYDEAAGGTVLARSTQQQPLKVVRAFRLADGTALVHLHNVSGGLLAGDRLTLSIRMSEGARAQLTTTGATRVYRAATNAEEASQRTEISLERNSLIEYLPDPIIPFAQSRFCQHTTIHLSTGAGLFWWEVLAPGREARGEIFEYDSVAMSTDLIAEGRTIFSDRIRLEPGKRPLSSPIRLGGFRYCAIFYICRVGLPAGLWLSLEKRLRVELEETNDSEVAPWGVSTLVADGLICRCAALRGRDVLAGLHRIWNTAKLALYGIEAVAPRKVN